jgi:hypothetical protein
MAASGRTPIRNQLDVLPVIPDDESWSQTGILLSDKDEHHWLTSNPIGYADWFYDRMNDIRIEESRTALAKQLDRSVEEIPIFLVRTPLQRVVQVLKRHRDIYFANRPGEGPPSVLITTLAAHAYDGQADVTDALLPMVYPSHYPRGSWGFDRPNAEPYAIVHRAVSDGVERSRDIPNAAAIIPWLQAFTLGDPPYGADEIRAQIQASYDAGVHEWVLWSPSVRYPREAFESR